MFMLFEFALLSFGLPMLKLLTSDVDFLEGLPLALAIVAGLI